MRDTSIHVTMADINRKEYKHAGSANTCLQVSPFTLQQLLTSKSNW